MLGLRKKQTPIGLDIGTSAVRAAQLESVGPQRRRRLEDERAPGSPSRRLAVVAAASSLLDSSVPQDVSGTTSSPRAADVKADSVARCLGRVRVGDWRGRRVAVALHHAALEFHALELPEGVLSPHDHSLNRRGGKTARSGDLEELVRWEVARLRAQPVEDSADHVVRHWVLPPPPIAAANVLAVAAQRAAVDEVLDACTAARLDCIQVDAGAAALARLGCQLCDWDPTAVWGILDLGYTASRLILCVANRPVLVRLVGQGGRAWTERIGRCLHLSPQSAETEKCEHGIQPATTVTPPGRQNPPDPGGSQAVSAAAGPNLHRAPSGRPRSRGRAPAYSATPRPSRYDVGSILFAALRNTLKDLAAEIKKSYEYVLSCYPRNRAADLILVGGGSAMRNLPEHLGGALGIPVRRISDYCTAPLADSCRLIVPEVCRNELHLLACAIGTAIPSTYCDEHAARASGGRMAAGAPSGSALSGSRPTGRQRPTTVSAGLRFGPEPLTAEGQPWSP